MKYLLAQLAANLVSLACVGVAGWLAVKGKEGWGWFLFVALLCACSMKMEFKD
jgi:hypothetical protein